MKNHPVYTDNDPQNELSTLNLGPTHPATHGVFQNVLQLDGERIVSGVSTIGYIHRAFEKIAEHRPFYQITPLTDRMNYCSSPINNMGWHMTVEKLLGITNAKTCGLYAHHHYGTGPYIRSYYLQWCIGC